MKKKQPADLDAKHYRDHSEPQYKRIHQIFDPSDFHESAHVLDIGCGDGRISAQIANLVPKGKVIGLDYSPNMVQFAQESFPKSSFPNLDFVHGNIEETSFPGQFDTIVCFNCLLWVRGAKKALNNICTFLKPGGKLLILTYLKESAYVDFLEDTLTAYPEYQPVSAAHTMLSAEEYRHSLNQHNLEFEEFKINHLISNYQDKEQLKNYVQGWLGSYVSLPEEIQDTFLNQAVKHSIKYSIDSADYPLNLPYKSLVIKAKKPI